jgi:hypothetical protein
MAHLDLPDDWQGWRLRGRHLVSPDGERITTERLLGLLWRDQLELRRAGYASRRRAEAARRDRQPVKVVIVELASLRCNGVFAA